MTDAGAPLVETGLADPPDHGAQLADFPEATAVTTLHRLSEYPDVWFFNAVDTIDSGGGGRFDLVAPRGTCYLADCLEGAVVEKLLRKRAKVVVAERLRELFHASVSVRSYPPSADLTARAATRWGLNAEIHTTLDYTITRRWAAAFHRAGRRALRYLLRGDASGSQAGIALFGGAGQHTRAPAGMSTDVQPLDDAEVVRLLAARGVEVRPIPSRVPVQPPR